MHDNINSWYVIKTVKDLVFLYYWVICKVMICIGL